MTTRKVGSEKRMRAIARSVVSNQLERKNNTVAATSVNATTAGAIVPISNGITEGDDVFQRSGTVIRLARIRLLLRGTAVTTSGSLRFILFRDMLSQQAFPTVPLLLSGSNLTSQYASTFQMQQHRFKILKDHTMDLNIAGQAVVTKQFDLPVKGTVMYNGATAVSGAEGPGSVYLLVIGTTATTLCDYTVQIVFTDA
jgi:hypothetical protein